MSMMSSQVVVSRERAKLEACMTCRLCNKLFSEATTISECLHTFCRKCIYEKIVDEEVDCCPVCKTDLGVTPLEKLRADNNWEDIRAKLFPSDKKKVKEPADHNEQDITVKLFPSEIKEVAEPEDHNVQDVKTKLFPSEKRKVKAPAVSLVTLPGKRKERYLSSLGTSTSRVSATGSVSVRKRYLTRRSSSLRGSLSIQEPDKKEEGHLQRLNSSETRKTDAVYTRQNSIEGSFKQHMANEAVEVNAQPEDGKADRFPLQLPVAKSVFPDTLNNDLNENKTTKENISKVHGNDIKCNHAPSGSACRKPQRGRKRKPALSEGLNIPAQFGIDTNNKRDRRFTPIWFSLIASNHQEGYAPLPQIPSCYLRVKDGSLPVSFIQKYLVKKLDRISEAEVEILLRGKPLIPSLQLHNLVDL